MIAIDTRHPERANWKTLVAQGPDKLEFANVVNNSFLLAYLKDARTEVRVHDLTGAFLRNVDLPGIGTAAGFGGKRKDKETFYAFTSFTSPATVYRYDPQAGKSTVFRQPKVDFDPTRYETKQVFYHSKDGTRVPMFLTYKKGIKLDGQNPTLLYAYGGFDISLTPFFSVPNLVWLEMGGVYAQPNLRGGGEYGEEWHQAGMKLKKQNVFDDFIAAAEWLIANKYTSTPKLAIRGGSNGGLLIGACVTQRPDLFGAALPEVGVMDMLRFHKFTIGWAWTSDYGSSDNAEEFKALYAYSPLHNLKPGTKYPPTLDRNLRPRRPRSSRPQLQIRRHHASRSSRTSPSPDSHRNKSRPRRRQIHHEANRRNRRHLGIRCPQPEHESGSATVAPSAGTHAVGTAASAVQRSEPVSTLLRRKRTSTLRQKETQQLTEPAHGNGIAPLTSSATPEGQPHGLCRRARSAGPSQRSRSKLHPPWRERAMAPGSVVRTPL